MAEMPDTLDKKEIGEFYKKAMAKAVERMKKVEKDEKKEAKKAAKEPKEPKAAKEPKEPKEKKEKVPKEKKEKKPKKEKKSVELDDDGNEIVKAKKALTGYQKFIQENRPKVKEEFPEYNGEQIFTKIAELWQQHKEQMKADALVADDKAPVADDKTDVAPVAVVDDKVPVADNSVVISVVADVKKVGKKGGKEKKQQA